MKMNSGYVLIDCTGLDLKGETTQTVSGIYQKCATALASGKPAYAGNVAWGDEKTSPISVMLTVDSGKITASACTLRLDISSDDSVKINNYIQ